MEFANVHTVRKCVVNPNCSRAQVSLLLDQYLLMNCSEFILGSYTHSIN